MKQHEVKKSTIPGDDLCAECGLPPWADTHTTRAPGKGRPLPA